MRFATTRSPADPDWVEYSPTFHAANPGKRSVAIDFSTRGRPRARAPARRARRRRRRELHPARDAERRPLLRSARGAAGPTSSWCGCRRSGSTARGATTVASRRPPSRSRESRGSPARPTSNPRALHGRPHRGRARCDRGAGRARAPSPHRCGVTRRVADGRGRAQRRRGADRHVSASGMLLDRQGNRGPTRCAARRVCVPRRRAVGGVDRRRRRRMACALRRARGTGVGPRSRARARRRTTAASRRRRPRARRVVRGPRP